MAKSSRNDKSDLENYQLFFEEVQVTETKMRLESDEEAAVNSPQAAGLKEEDVHKLAMDQQDPDMKGRHQPEEEE